LPADELARFRAWFEEFEAARFDEPIGRDAKAGKLDQLAEQALADFHASRARDSFGADSADLIGSLKGKLTIKREILATTRFPRWRGASLSRLGSEAVCSSDDLFPFRQVVKLFHQVKVVQSTRAIRGPPLG
jgi:hypothetical protein